MYKEKNEEFAMIRKNYKELCTFVFCIYLLYLNLSFLLFLVRESEWERQIITTKMCH
jgi:Trk-type K+ transport system membrane component